MSDVADLKTIDAEILHQKIVGDYYPIIINALAKDPYLAQHIPGSINIPTDNAEITEDVIPFKDSEIVVYCASADCDASPKLAKKLEEMGYDNVSDFEEGLAGWREAGYKLVGNDV